MTRSVLTSLSCQNVIFSRQESATSVKEVLVYHLNRQATVVVASTGLKMAYQMGSASF